MEKIRYQQIYDHEKEHWWYKGRRELLLKIVSSIGKNKNQKILDIGCGAGFNLVKLGKFGKASGVDVSREAIHFCRKRGLKNIHLIRAGKYPFPDKSFNLITCLDVLEHIDKDSRELVNFRKKLAPQGKIVIFVPAFSALWGKLDEKSRHFRRYTKSQLKTKLSRAGFKVEKIGYFGFLFFLPILLVRLIQRLPFGKNNQWGVEPHIRSFGMNRILSAVFTFDVALSYRIPFPFGSSIFLIASNDRTKVEK
jgi:SAM-dependent methyltransferase